MKNVIFVMAFFIVCLPSLAFSQTNWKMNSGSISFKIKNAGITVTGRFQGLQTTLIFSPDKLATSSLKGSVEVATLKTGIDKRDKDLMEEQYFNVDKFKSIEITSVKLYKKGAQYAGLFKINIKGVTREIEIPFDLIQQGKEAEFKSDFTINRRDFGVGGRSAIMADDLNVSIDVKASN